MIASMKNKPLSWIAGLAVVIVLSAWGSGRFRSGAAKESTPEPTSGARYDFNKGVPEGLVFLEDGKTVIRNAKVKIGEKEGFLDSEDVFRVETVHVTVRDGRAIKERRKYLKGEKQGRVQIGEQVLPEFEIDPLLGESVETEVVGNELRHVLVGKKPNEKQAPLLRALPHHPAMKWFPDEPIAVGTKWDIDAKSVTNFPSGFETIEKGSWTRHFRKIEPIDGDPCAEIFEELNVVGKSRNQLGVLKVSFQGTVTGWRSLKTNLTRKEIVEGTFTSDGPLPSGLNMWFSGKIKTNITRSPK